MGAAGGSVGGALGVAEKIKYSTCIITTMSTVD